MDPRLLARDLLQRHKLTLAELWLYYWGNGGNTGEMEFDAFIHGIDGFVGVELDLLSSALDDARRDRGGHW